MRGEVKKGKKVKKVNNNVFLVNSLFKHVSVLLSVPVPVPYLYHSLHCSFCVFSLVVNTGKLSSILHPPSDSNRNS